MFAKSLWNRLCPTLRLIYISGPISSRCHPSGSIGKRSDDKETSGYSLKHNTWRICIFLLLSLFILVVNIISVHTWTSCPCAHKHIYFRSSPLFSSLHLYLNVSWRSLFSSISFSFFSHQGNPDSRGSSTIGLPMQLPSIAHPFYLFLSLIELGPRRICHLAYTHLSILPLGQEATITGV